MYSSNNKVCTYTLQHDKYIISRDTFSKNDLKDHLYLHFHLTSDVLLNQNNVRILASTYEIALFTSSFIVSVSNPIERFRNISSNYQIAIALSYLFSDTESCQLSLVT